MTDEGGVLGNLPNSRPGKRSAKRDSARGAKRAASAGRPAKAAAKAAAKAEAGGKAAAKPAPASRAARTSAKPGRATAGAASPSGRPTAVKGGGIENGVDVDPALRGKGRHDRVSEPGDAVGAAVRTAAGLAATGVKVAGAVTQELLRRLPRP